ncbi:MAG: DUF3617 family protein [Desulfosalsimonas sp.]|uniref:DUF3617 domain-containing protein n=1 Tax=Desulfosalsimonas sp. TaxID=3073848 RepID=UPI003970D9C0
MKKGIFFFLIAVAALCYAAVSVSVHAAGPNIKEGQWEITTDLEIPGMSSDMPQQSFTHTECLNNDDYVPQGSQNKGAGGDCEIKNVRTSGDTVSWTMHCNTGQGNMDGEGTITYRGDTFEGTINTVMQGGMKMTQHLQGRRIGDCN